MSRKLTEQEKEFAQQVRKYRKLKAKQAKLAEQVDDLKAEILDYLEGCEGKTVKGNGFTACASSRVRSTFDKKLLAKALPGEDLSKFQHKTSYVVLAVK